MARRPNPVSGLFWHGLQANNKPYNFKGLQEKIKKIYDRKTKAENFQLDDVVLRWDARNEDKGKHGKFDNLWKGPYKISAYRG